MSKVWEHLYHRAAKASGIYKHIKTPIRLQDEPADKECYDYLYSIVKDPIAFLKQHRNLSIISDTVGNGKTLWAMKLSQAIIASLCTDVTIGKQPLLFARYTDMVFLLSSFTALGNDRDRLAELDKYRTVPVLVIDDLGTGQMSKHGYPLFYSLIDSRYTNGLPTIITSNLGTDELTDRLGERVVDRLINQSDILIFKGRGKRE